MPNDFSEHDVSCLSLYAFFLFVHFDFDNLRVFLDNEQRIYIATNDTHDRL